MQLWFAVEPDALVVAHVDAATEWHARQLLGRVFSGAAYARHIPAAEAPRLLTAGTHFGCRVFLNARSQVQLRPLALPTELPEESENPGA